MSSLPYITICLKESLRMYTPVPGFGRVLTKPTIIDGVELLPGTSVWVGAHLLHHNPVVWGHDHMEFKPERFLPENMKTMDSFAFCPFSAGPRYSGIIYRNTYNHIK